MIAGGLSDPMSAACADSSPNHRCRIQPACALRIVLLLALCPDGRSAATSHKVTVGDSPTFSPHWGAVEVRHRGRDIPAGPAEDRQGVRVLRHRRFVAGLSMTMLGACSRFSVAVHAWKGQLNERSICAAGRADHTRSRTRRVRRSRTEGRTRPDWVASVAGINPAWPTEANLPQIRPSG